MSTSGQNPEERNLSMDNQDLTNQSPLEYDASQDAGSEQTEDMGNEAEGVTEVTTDENVADDEEAELDEIDALKMKIEELQNENSTLKDQFLRKQADFENYRKRMVREKQETAKFSNQQLLLDLLPIIDDFERAINSAEESRDFDSFHEGVTLIEKQFTSMLERKWGLTRFDSVNEEFNPQYHEAVTTEETEDESSMVLEDYQKGYMLHDRVLRAAKVKVSMPNRESTSADSETEKSE